MSDLFVTAVGSKSNDGVYAFDFVHGLMGRDIDYKRIACPQIILLAQ
jgi:hypothetical protein